jgi:hypothetical protein
MQMKQTITAILCLAFLSTIGTACKKNKEQKTDCFSDNNIYREINNQPATIQQLSNGDYYMVEPNTIDSRLFPCNLPAEFKQKNLAVRITGQVKSMPNTGIRPTAGDQGFTITNITRQ